MSTTSTQSDTKGSSAPQQTISEYAADQHRKSPVLGTVPFELSNEFDGQARFFGEMLESLVYATSRYLQKIKTAWEKNIPKPAESKSASEPPAPEGRSPARAQSFDPEGELSEVVIFGMIAIACAKLEFPTSMEGISVLAQDWTVPKLEQVLVDEAIAPIDGKERAEIRPIDAAPMALAKLLGNFMFRIIGSLENERVKQYGLGNREMFVTKPLVKDNFCLIVRGFLCEFLAVFPDGAKYFQQKSMMPIAAPALPLIWGLQQGESLPVVKWMSVLAALVEKPVSSSSIDSKPESAARNAPPGGL